MDETERLTIEREVQEHLARAEELMATLRALEERIESLSEPPRELVMEVRALKLELRGRMAAVAVGEGRLGVDPL